ATPRATPAIQTTSAVTNWPMASRRATAWNCRVS
ncbi:uncharacterized protein METZ01_LOCUS428033, partial [marine metagenome]